MEPRGLAAARRGLRPGAAAVRHVTIHQADQRHYTRGNAAVAVLLTTSVLRALQGPAEESPGDPGTSASGRITMPFPSKVRPAAWEQGQELTRPTGG